MPPFDKSFFLKLSLVDAEKGKRIAFEAERFRIGELSTIGFVLFLGSNF